MNSDEKEAREAYQAWRKQPHGPPRTAIDPGMGRTISSEQVWLASWAASRKRAGEALKEAVDLIADDLRDIFDITNPLAVPAIDTKVLTFLMKHERIVQNGDTYRWK